MAISVITPECINEVMNTKVDTTPQPRMGATIFVGSDRYPMVVIEVLSPKKVTIAHIPRELEDQFVTDENGIMWLPEDLYNELVELGKRKFKYSAPREAPILYTLRKNGRWMPKGEGLWGTCSARFGYAEHYWDPCF